MTSPGFILVAVLLLSSGAYFLGRKRAFSVAGGAGRIDKLHSRPTYYGRDTDAPVAVNLVINDIKNQVGGNIVSGVLDPEMEKAAENYKHLRSISNTALAVVVILLGLGSIAFVRRLISPVESQW